MLPSVSGSVTWGTPGWWEKPPKHFLDELLSRSSARTCGAIALKEDAQAVEGQQVVDLLDIARVRSNQAREASAGDDARRLGGIGTKHSENASSMMPSTSPM